MRRTATEALIRQLLRHDDPALSDPLVPWAIVVDRGDGVAITASTMLPSGVFWAIDQGPDGPVLLAATDPGAVLRQRRVRTELDLDWLRTWLAKCAAPDQTPYLGIHRLLPGHTLAWQPGSPPRLLQWCGPTAWGHRGHRAKVTVADYRDQFDAVIDAIVRASPRMVATVSGGLDSTYALARAASSDALTTPIQARIATPAPGATPIGRRRVFDEYSYARELADSYGSRINLARVVNTAAIQPLDVAAQVAAAAWFPSPSPSNQVWLGAIASEAESHGATLLLNGQRGNFSFSPFSSPSNSRRRLAQAVGRRGQEMPRPDRRMFLAHLANHVRPNLAVTNPAAHPGLLNADPFVARPILDMAAAVTDRQWGCEPWPRGFARRVAHNVLPDSIRLRVARGAQAPDVWTWITHQRERYLDEAAQLSASELTADIDIDDIRRRVAAWPWGEPCGPGKQTIEEVHRILATVAFARDTQARLVRLAVQ